MSSATATKPSKREQTRSHLIRCTIDCIYEEGFNAAHTNRICERAGVSWGVIQYHFGDKDGLLVAVVDAIFDGFSEQLAEEIKPQCTLEQRLRHLLDRLWGLLSQREYRVSLAILRNIGRAPDSPLNEAELLESWSKRIGRLWDVTFRDLPTPSRSTQAKRIMFAALRGFADEINPHGRKKTIKRELDALADALLFLLKEDET